MPDDRVTVYRFGAGQHRAAVRMIRALYKARLRRPALVIGGGRTLITLPASQLPALRALQRDEPERFGGC